MKSFFTIIAVFFLVSCNTENRRQENETLQTSIQSTWRLISGTVIEKGDTIVTDYTKNVSFIKIINATHFAFLQHDLNGGKDSTALFVAGGGSYSLRDSSYTEYLEYCSAREWEGHDFTFALTIRDDTLVQRGIEKVEAAGVNRINIEKYVRMEN